MEKQPNKSAAAAAVAAGKDLISELPDEILHSIIRRIACSKSVEQTIALSSRWRNLWRSYPVVQLNPKTGHKFYSIGSEGFQKFHDATMKRFNQDKLLQMEALKLSIQINYGDLDSSHKEVRLHSDDDNFHSPAVEQLLELASERKAEYIDIEVNGYAELGFPFGLLSNSSAKTLKLERISLFAPGNDDLLVSLNSLRYLHLNNVTFLSLHLNNVRLTNDRFDGDQLFAELIASSPHLETLKLENVSVMEKVLQVDPATKVRWGSSLKLKGLQVSNLTNLKKLKTLRFLHLNNAKFDDQLLADLIVGSPLLETLKLERIHGIRELKVSNSASLKKLEIYCCLAVEIQIAAFGLQDLHIRQSDQVFGLIAPQLNVLQLCCYHELSLCEFSDDLNHLRFLCLDELTFDDEQVFLNLIAANPLLETLQLRNIRNLKKLQLSNVPNLKMLVVAHCDDLEEIEIAAYELHSFHLFGRKNCKRMLHKIELIAPQLNDLKIKNYGLRMVDLKSIFCKLQYLKYLNLVGIARSCQKKTWKPEFAGRKLEEFILWVSKGLKKTELDADAGPSVLNFLRSYKH